MCIKEKIKDKNVLFVPIFSARSYETGIYNLTVDGNMARIISMILKSKPKEAIVLIPENVNGLEEIKQQLSFYKSVSKVNFVNCDAYGKNAAETRSRGYFFLKFINEHFAENDFDYIIAEPNSFFIYAKKENFSAEIIYWCVASITSKGAPWFVKDYAYIDKKIAKNFETECVLNTQVEELKGMSYSDKEGFYDASQFDYETIFFPFRLTDENYKTADFLCAIEKIKNTCKKPFKVLFTDVNDSNILVPELTKYSDIFVRVSSQKEVYLQILKSKPIIPYLENVDVLTHININEFMYYGCRLIMFENDIYSGHDNVTFIKNIEELSEELKRRIENGE